MTLLLDTHLLLWAAGDSGQLSSKAQNLLGDPATELMFSTASIWEIVIKSALDRDDFRVDPQRFRNGLIQNGYSELEIRSEHALTVGSLPLIHKDPLRPHTHSASAGRKCHAAYHGRQDGSLFRSHPSGLIDYQTSQNTRRCFDGYMWHLRPPCRDVIAWNHVSTPISVLTSSRQSLARVLWSLAPAGRSRAVSRARCRT